MKLAPAKREFLLFQSPPLFSQNVHHSVLIAAYNAAAFIPKALASLRAQTDTDWELIVVEDGSRDGTEHILHAFTATVAQPVRYENAIVNQGVAAARTRLLALARGELCSFLDADDTWTPRHLAAARQAASSGSSGSPGSAVPSDSDSLTPQLGPTALRAATSAPPAAPTLIVSDISLHDIDNNHPLGTYTPPPSLAATPAATLLRTSAIMTSSCVTLRRTLAIRVGPFDPAFRIGEDRDYWLRCALAGARFALTHENTCTYSKHAASTMTRTQLWAAAETAFQEKHNHLDVLPRRERNRLLAHALQNEARLIRRADPARSARLLSRALTLAPLAPALAAQWAYTRFLARSKS